MHRYENCTTDIKPCNKHCIVASSPFRIVKKMFRWDLCLHVQCFSLILYLYFWSESMSENVCDLHFFPLLLCFFGTEATECIKLQRILPREMPLVIVYTTNSFWVTNANKWLMFWNFNWITFVLSFTSDSKKIDLADIYQLLPLIKKEWIQKLNILQCFTCFIS